MRARAAIFVEPSRPLVLEEVELDAPRAEEVVVRMAGAGVCHTDLVAAEGRFALPLPSVLGHEGAGVVEEVGPGVTALRPGDHVVLSFDSCRACPTCAAGRPAYCRSFAALNYSGARLDGSVTLRREGSPLHGSFLGQSSFATRAIASVRNAVKVDDDLPLALLGPLGCGLLTGAGAVLNVLRPGPGADVAIFGAGTVGLAGVMAAAVAGCARVVAIEPDPGRRALALELGATDALAPEEVGRLAVDLALETVGTEDVIRSALRALRSPGTCATVGFRGGRNEVRVDQGRLLYGRTLTGVIEGDADPHELIPRLLALHREGRFAFDRLITTYPFEEVDAALRGGAIKPVLLFG